MSFGVLFIAIAEIMLIPIDISGSKVSSAQYILGIFLALCMATLSSIEVISTEIALKQKIPYVIAQFWLYLPRCISALLLCLIDIGQNILNDRGIGALFSTSSRASLRTIIFLIAITAFTRFVMIGMLRKKTSLASLVGISISIVIVAVLSLSLKNNLNDSPTARLILGSGLIITLISTLNYYEYQVSAATDVSELIPNEEYSSKRASSQHRRPRLVPTRIHGIMGVMLLIIIYIMKPIVSRSSLNDTERFFSPNGIEPAVWGVSANPTHCVQDFVTREEIKPLNGKLQEWEYGFLRSGCPVYPIPSTGLFFHVYWNGPWRPFNSLTVEAWLATQRLGDNHRLVYWYEGDGPSHSEKSRLTKGAYKKYVEFRRLDKLAEGKGFCVENMQEWNDREYQEALNMPIQSQSDMIRILLLAKYGGVWLDADTIPLRDLTSLIRSGPSAAGMEGEIWNNNVLVFGPASAGIGARVLETMCSLTYNATAYHQRQPAPKIEPFSWYWIFNDGVLETCAEETHCGINRHPSAFLDGIKYARPCPDEPKGDPYPMDGPLPPIFNGLWAWHARLGARDDKCLEYHSRSLAVALRWHVRRILDSGLEMGGRSVVTI